VALRDRAGSASGALFEMPSVAHNQGRGEGVSTWTARGLAWSVGIVSIVLLVVALVLIRRSRERPPWRCASWSASDGLRVLVSIGVPILGIVIVNKRPRKAVRLDLHGRGDRARASELRSRSTHCTPSAPIPGPCRPDGSGRGVSNVVWPIPLAALILMFPWGEGAARFRRDSVALVEHRWIRLIWTTALSQVALFPVFLLSLRALGVSEQDVSTAEAFAVYAFSRSLSAIAPTPGGLG
jgi:hypothetical protein